MSPTALATRAATTVRDRLQTLTAPTVASTRDLTIEAFMRETGVTIELVTGFVDSIVETVKGFTAKFENSGHAGWHPDTEWLESYHDQIFLIAMIDNTKAAPGSAHARLEDLCSEAVVRRITLTHTRADDHSLSHCLLYCEAVAN